MNRNDIENFCDGIKTIITPFYVAHPTGSPSEDEVLAYIDLRAQTIPSIGRLFHNLEQNIPLKLAFVKAMVDLGIKFTTNQQWKIDMDAVRKFEKLHIDPDTKTSDTTPSCSRIEWMAIYDRGTE